MRDDYLFGHLIRACSSSSAEEIEIDFVERRFSPEGAVTAEIRFAFEGLFDLLDAIADSVNVVPGTILTARMTFACSLSEGRRHPRGPIEYPCTCTCVITDVLGGSSRSERTVWEFSELPQPPA